MVNGVMCFCAVTFVNFNQALRYSHRPGAVDGAGCGPDAGHPPWSVTVNINRTWTLVVITLHSGADQDIPERRAQLYMCMSLYFQISTTPPCSKSGRASGRHIHDGISEPKERRRGKRFCEEIRHIQLGAHEWHSYFHHFYAFADKNQNNDIAFDVSFCKQVKILQCF